MLGRSGDILNALPIAYHIFQTTAEKPFFMSSKEYASLLDGCSYLTPLVFNGPFEDIKRAYSQLEGKYDQILVPQVYGRDWECQKIHDSFCKDGWQNSGLIDLFGKVPLVFDRRDSKREAFLKARWIKSPTILLNFSGQSSPFPQGEIIRRELEMSWGLMCNIVDLSKIRAHKLYDLLGLYDAADILITSDTATLHLAQGSNIPSIQFIVDRPTMWHGSTPKGNCIFSCRYEESVKNLPAIMGMIASQIGNDNLQRIVHAYSSFQGNQHDKVRNQWARVTWENAYKKGGWIPMPTPDEALTRTFECNGKRLPYLKDIIDASFCTGTMNDWICLTNTDTCFAAELHDKLQVAMNAGSMLYGFRRDFSYVNRVMTESQVQQGVPYPGNDLFFFPKSWWASVRKSFPDVLIGREAWDACMRELLIQHGAHPLHDSIYHQSHQSVWEQRGNRYSIPSQVHNRTEASNFLNSIGVNPSSCGV